MPSDSLHLAYLATNADDLSLERYEIGRHLARLGLLNIAFPCSDEGDGYDWNLSRKLIEQADIFILVVGDTYGPVSPIGISYLHREYVHARTVGKPIHAFIKISDTQASTDESRLQGFRQLIKQQVAFKMWHLRDELVALLSSTVPSQQARLGDGWARMPTQHSSSPFIDFDKVNLPKATPAIEAPNKTKLISDSADVDREAVPTDAQKLREVGRAILALEVHAKVYQGGNLFRETLKFPVRSDQLYKMLAPALTDRVSEDRLRSSADASIRPLVSAQLLERHPAAHAVDDVRIQKKQFHSILEDWQLAGVISCKTDSNRTYWKSSD